MCLFSASHTCETETAKQQKREEEICDVFRTSSQDGRCVEGGIQGACVCMCVMSVWMCLHVCELVRQSEYLWVSEQAWRRHGCTQSDVVSDGHWCRPPLLILPPQAPRLRWLATPAGVVNLQFPLHNQSRRARVEELHNIKLSETSCKGSFGCCVLSEVDTRASGHGTLVYGSHWLVLLTHYVQPGVEPGNPAAVWLCKSSHRGPLNHSVYWA